jgi:hypothetical protein
MDELKIISYILFWGWIISSSKIEIDGRTTGSAFFRFLIAVMVMAYMLTW